MEFEPAEFGMMSAYYFIRFHWSAGPIFSTCIANLQLTRDRHGRVCISFKCNVTDSGSWSVVFVAIIIGVLCVAGYVFAPKGDNQTYINFHKEKELTGAEYGDIQ